MKYKLIMGALPIALMLFGGATAQQAVSPPHKAQTYMEREMYQTSNLDNLKYLYDTLKTDYDRRYFLCALPDYFGAAKVQATPQWVNDAVIAGLSGKDPLYVCNAVMAAGALRINCSSQLMDLYKTVHTTFGCHEDMIVSAIFSALTRLDDPGKAAFFNEVLANNHYPLLSASFSALIEAMGTAPTPAFTPKLAEYSDSLSALTTKLQAGKEEEWRLEQCRKVSSKVNDLRKKIGGN